MTRVSWDSTSPVYFQGVSNGVLYLKNSPGIPWNGLISVTEKGDSNANSFYIDGVLYKNRIAPSAFSGTISAFIYPDELEPYIGVNKGITGQIRKPFGLTYRNNREIHIVYNAFLGASSDQYQSLNDNPNPVSFSWEFATVPAVIPGGRASSHLVIMVDYAHPGALSDLEDMLYGDSANDPFLPDPKTVINLFDTYALVRIIDNGDGSWTAIGPDEFVFLTDSETFTINYPTAVMISADEYTVHSL